MTENIWKLDWTPTGVEETFTLDTTHATPGDILPLKRTFFKASGIRATLTNGQLLSISTTDDKADLILYNQELRLSEMIGEPVYQSVRLGARAVNGFLTITAVYVADRISSEIFNQDLHQDADVIHYSMDTVITTTQEFTTTFARIDESIELPNGSISKNKTIIGGEIIHIGKFDLSSSDFITDSSETGLFCSNGSLRFDSDKGAWVRKIGNSRELPLLSLYDEAIPVGGIPLTNMADQTTLTFVPWFTTDPSLHLVKMEQFQASKAKIEETSCKVVHIGDFTMEVDVDGNLNINNAIKIDRNGIVTIGFVTFSANKLAKLESLL